VAQGDEVQGYATFFQRQLKLRRSKHKRIFGYSGENKSRVKRGGGVEECDDVDMICK